MPPIVAALLVTLLGLSAGLTVLLTAIRHARGRTS